VNLESKRKRTSH